ncbi:hypothetical protein OIE66_11910 [Nonomuraea sp. NBC_01738]|uniref:hypothetical protein n=1 Tax=Nonomuraea sp. NBC_01738 TaxID=2976003 RepID=UPI002E11F30C|nr:hypothetical protein OIE66_11910 [Nonomuraea sp. NBC_01738]
MTLLLTFLLVLSGASWPALDGFVIGHLPPGAGRASDFAYESDEGVRFVSRVWERPGAVDLTVAVLRGPELATGAGLRAFMAAYHERSPGSWSEVRVGGRPGFGDGDEVFWLAAPGVAVSVAIDAGRFGGGELMKVAESVRDG